MKKLFYAIILLIFGANTAQNQVLSLKWAKHMGGATNDQGLSIATDLSGNVYSTGQFRGTADFDPGPGTFNLTSLGDADIFVSKLDSSGNFLWAKQFGGTDAGSSNAIAVDDEGNVYTTGQFRYTFDFDPGPGTYFLTSNANNSAFISKLNSSGNFEWAKQIGGSNNVLAQAITIDKNGNVLTTGYFLGTADFDPGPGTYNITSLGFNDIYISKLNASGDFAWANKLAGTANDIGYTIAVDTIGNVYTSGFFGGTADFDPGPGVFNMISAGSNDIFISKLDTAGIFVWAKQIGGTSADYAKGIVLDNDGYIYLTGYFTGIVDLNPGPESNIFTSTNSTYDVYICKYDGSCNYIWAKQFEGFGTDYGLSIAVDGSGNVYTAGRFTDICDFDPGSGTFNLNAGSNTDAFISKLNSSGEFVRANQIGGTGSDFGSSVAVDANNNVLTTGYFSDRVDFDPNSGVYNLTSFGGNDIFVCRLSECISELATVSILADKDIVCPGDSVTFTATSINGGTPTYQWYTNGNPTGMNQASYTYIPSNHDQVMVVLTSSISCAPGNSATSNTITVAVDQGLEQPSAITGSAAPIPGSSQNYSVINVPGVTYTWTFPAGWVQTGGGATNSVTVIVGNTAGDIEATPSTACGIGTASTLAVIPALETISVNTIIVSDGKDYCYNATGNIIVAGGETIFLVQAGGQATFIAGQMISFLPGTTVDPGGYLLGTITTTGQYCNQTVAPIPAKMMGRDEIPGTNVQLFFRAYPNPTTGTFSLDIIGETSLGKSKVEIFNMLGDQVLNSELSGSGKHELTLSGKPDGIYVIRVISGNRTEAARIIKQ